MSAEHDDLPRLTEEEREHIVALDVEREQLEQATPAPMVERLEITLDGSPALRRVLNVERTSLGQIHITLWAAAGEGGSLGFPGFQVLASSFLNRREVAAKIVVNQSRSGSWTLWVGVDVSYQLTEAEAITLIDAFGFRVDRASDAEVQS